jgi:hypothetical protein
MSAGFRGLAGLDDQRDDDEGELEHYRCRR